MRSAVDGVDFARHRDPGLAIFAAHQADGNSLLEVVSLPQSPTELVTAGTDCHIKPLLPLVAANQRFDILALSKANVRLLTATPFTWTELPLEALPIEAQAELDFPSGGGGWAGAECRTGRAQETACIKSTLHRHGGKGGRRKQSGTSRVGRRFDMSPVTFASRSRSARSMSSGWI